jgi:PAS domain-containing protein
VQAVEAGLAEVQADESYPLRVARALSGLFPDCAASVYDRSESGDVRTIAHTFSGPPSTEWVSPFEQIPRIAMYSVWGRDPWANTPIETATLYRGRPAELDEFRHLVRPLGVWHQLRVVVYDGDRFVAHGAVLSSKRQGEFGQRARDRLAAVLPSLVDGLVLWRLVGHRALSAGPLSQILDSFDQPAWLLQPGGDVAYANPAARSRWSEGLPGWLGERVTRGADAFTAHRSARIQPLEVDGRTLHLVIPRLPSPVGARSRARATEETPSVLELPESLRPVARLLAAGWADKDVAQDTGLTLSTVRTYVQRIYRRLGVASRIELAERLAS